MVHARRMDPRAVPWLLYPNRTVGMSTLLHFTTSVAAFLITLSNRNRSTFGWYGSIKKFRAFVASSPLLSFPFNTLTTRTLHLNVLPPDGPSISQLNYGILHTTCGTTEMMPFTATIIFNSYLACHNYRMVSPQNMP